MRPRFLSLKWLLLQLKGHCRLSSDSRFCQYEQGLGYTLKTAQGQEALRPAELMLTTSLHRVALSQVPANQIGCAITGDGGGEGQGEEQEEEEARRAPVPRNQRAETDTR